MSSLLKDLFYEIKDNVNYDSPIDEKRQLFEIAYMFLKDTFEFFEFENVVYYISINNTTTIDLFKKIAYTSNEISKYYIYFVNGDTKDDLETLNHSKYNIKYTTSLYYMPKYYIISKEDYDKLENIDC